MKKLLVITFLLGALFLVTDASAATFFVRMGVDDDLVGGFAYVYSVQESYCGTGCKEWYTTSLPTTFFGMHARIEKDGSGEYNDNDWDAINGSGIESNPTSTSTYVPASGDRVYEMTHYWGTSPKKPWERETYYYQECMNFMFQYNDDGPWRTRLFSTDPQID